MSSVKVGFSASSSIFSRTVRFFTRSKIGHTFLIVEKSFFGIDMVLEASFGGFHLTTLKKFSSENTILEVIDLGQGVDSGLKKSLRRLGERYDYLGVLGTALVLLGRFFGMRILNPFNTKAMFCSEAIVRILQASNYPESLSLIPSTVTPVDLYNFLKNNSPPPVKDTSEL